MTDILNSEPCQQILSECREFRDRIYTLVKTIFTFIKQILNPDKSCVSDYCNYLETSYLCFFLNRYHTSVKTQYQSSKKIYFIDHALARNIGFRFSDDSGRLLENIVFIELKRRFQRIYYHREKKNVILLYNKV